MNKPDEIRLLARSPETVTADGRESHNGQNIIRIINPEGFDETLRPQEFHAVGFSIECLSAETPFTMQTDLHVEIEMTSPGRCNVRLK